MDIEVGMKIGRLTVLEKTVKKRKSIHRKTGFSNIGACVCLCECGNTIMIANQSIKSGAKSCGCLQRDSARAQATHNLSNSKIYSHYKAMKQRCTNKKNKKYPLYGGRGIVICEKWQTFEGFLEDMGPTWEKGLTLDRIDGNGNYCKENCRWATTVEQNYNTTRNVLWLHDGKWLSRNEFAEILNINPRCLGSKFYKDKYIHKKLYSEDNG
jgi:hypothetical protein